MNYQKLSVASLLISVFTRGKRKGIFKMRKSTVEALAKLDAWRKAYKKWRWIKNVWWDFTDAYCQDNSPVSTSDLPEINRLRNKIEAYEDKAHCEWENLEGEAWELKKRYWCNKTFMARFNEIAQYIARIELDLPDDYVFPTK